MKLSVFVFFILFTSFCFAQEGDTSDMEEYNSLLNYIPSSFREDTTAQNKRYANLHTLVLLSYFSWNHLSNEETQWYISRTRQLAEALFEDKKLILLKEIGGANGCNEPLLDTIRLSEISVIELKICKTCMDFENGKELTETFNERMYSLMAISPTDSKENRKVKRRKK